ncbi:uncharacterized protein LOC142231946 [Haematobia irritans]|uniref:uncharacterized protein LOC142231946 n=1 Tax=Haematobia irritans TaxID=7368 RepID=UPI003F4FE1A0
MSHGKGFTGLPGPFDKSSLVDRRVLGGNNAEKVGLSTRLSPENPNISQGLRPQVDAAPLNNDGTGSQHDCPAGANGQDSTITRPSFSPLTGHGEGMDSGGRLDSTSVFEAMEAAVSATQASMLQIMRSEMKAAVAETLRNALSGSLPQSNSSANVSQEVDWPHDLPPMGGDLPPTQEGNNSSYKQSRRTQRPPNANESSQRTPYIDLGKWGIRFDGTAKTPLIEDFMFRVERLQGSYGCSDQEMVNGFHHLLEGRANQWYWNRIQLHPNINFENLKIDMIREFQKYHTNIDVLRQMMDRKQGKDERATDYIDAIQSLRTQLREPLQPYEVVDIIKSGLKPKLASLIFSTQIYSVEHLRSECRKAEDFIDREYQHRTRFNQPVRVVNELFDFEDVVDRVEELRIRPKLVTHRDNTEGEKIRCWNCNSSGHGFKQCPSMQRNLFCYRCGSKGVTAPQCINCRQGNLSSNTAKGESRSTQTVD